MAVASPRSVVPVVLVAAVADNGVIGAGGAMPWRLKAEMAHFRSVTMGKPLVMGRKTFQSIGGPLKGRTTIVVSRDTGFSAPGIVVARTVADALLVATGDALRRGADAIAVIGGAEIYRQTMPCADRLVISQVHLRPTGDTKFPTIDPAAWKESERREHPPAPGDTTGFTVVVYRRGDAAAQ
jgi:dihydrofolate reductase